MWVQLRSCKQIEVQGKPTNYRPGDWVETNNKQARRWLERGEAVIPSRKIAELLPGDAGVILTQDHAPARKMLATYGDLLPVQTGEPSMPWGRTFIWDTVSAIKLELIPQGFHLLETWQVAVPLLDYNTLALHMGNEEDRERTKAVVHDLRVPCYDPGALWVRRCPATERLLEMWREELGDRALALLRSIYAVKPLILALPPMWAGGGQ